MLPASIDHIKMLVLLSPNGTVTLDFLSRHFSPGPVTGTGTLGKSRLPISLTPGKLKYQKAKTEALIVEP